MKVVDADIRLGSWAVVASREERYRVYDDSRRIIWPGGEFPVVGRQMRIMPDGRFVAWNSRSEKGATNCWIYNTNGSLASGFPVGDAISDLLPVGDLIVATYFDEGVFGGHDSYGREAICIFDLRGRLQWGYHSEFGYDNYEIYDVYCGCVDEIGRLVAYPYGKPNFPLLRIDPVSRSRETSPRRP